MNLTRRGSLPFGWKIAVALITVAVLQALKLVAGDIFAVIAGFVLFLILVCAYALTIRS